MIKYIFSCCVMVSCLYFLLIDNNIFNRLYKKYVRKNMKYVNFGLFDIVSMCVSVQIVIRVHIS